MTPDCIEWRESELKQTVHFLDQTNAKGWTAERIKNFAWRSFHEGGCKPTFVGTAGWYVSIVRKAWDDKERPFIALVSVMAYSALKGIERCNGQ